MAEDVPQMVEVEREAFPTNGPATPFKRDLSNRRASYLVAYVPTTPGQPPGTHEQAQAHSHGRPRPGGLKGLLKRLLGRASASTAPTEDTEYVAGYVATWSMADEAHITAIAVRESLRGNGVGELLLLASIEQDMRRRYRVSTLEVRVSNNVAQALYSKYGFKQVGLRKRYYTDNHEDAYIMTTDPIASPVYVESFHRLVEAYRARHGEVALALG